jgi:hypothetical protein
VNDDDILRTLRDEDPALAARIEVLAEQHDYDLTDFYLVRTYKAGQRDNEGTAPE